MNRSKLRKFQRMYKRQPRRLWTIHATVEWQDRSRICFRCEQGHLYTIRRQPPRACFFDQRSGEVKFMERSGNQLSFDKKSLTSGSKAVILASNRRRNKNSNCALAWVPQEIWEEQYPKTMRRHVVPMDEAA